MKALENKPTTILRSQPMDGQPVDYCDYCDLIATAVNQSDREKGFSPTEMRKRMRILKALDQTKNDPENLIVLEDHDADKLQEILKMSKWPYLHESVTQLE